MKRNVVETVLGAVVIIGAIIFLAFSYKTANVSSSSGYHVYAIFSETGGLKVGDDVQISGVKVGQVSNIALDPKILMAKVTLEVSKDIKLPEDTSAFISSVSLLGGKYMSLQLGNEETFLEENGRIKYTQAPQNLEELLGKFIFSMSGKKDDSAEEKDQPASP